MTRFGTGLVFAATVFWLSVVTFATEPVKRQTDSVESDLITALIARNRLDLAVRICESHLNETQVDDDTLARWLIQAARVDNAFALQQEATGDGAASISPLSSTQRIERFLAGHPDYPQRSWLKFQSVVNELAFITREALSVLVSTGDQQHLGRERVLGRIVRAQTELRELSKEVEEQINVARSKTPASSEVQDLVSLVYLLAEKRISTVLLQGDLFEPGSPDSIASATEAMTAAKQMIDSLPAGTLTRAKFLKLYAESLRRIVRFTEAEAAINESLSINRADGESLACAIRIAIDAGRIQHAQQLVATFPLAGIQGELELRLAMLELTIAEAKQASRPMDQQSLSQQVQQIRERFGPHAKRRAQRMVLGVIPTDNHQAIDPQLLIARAGQSLREGKADQAVDELMNAARQAKSAKDAFAFVVGAAAIERNRKEYSSAAEDLREIALAHPDDADAPKLHYQATMMMRSHWPAAALSEQLQEFLSTWPLDPLAVDAANWLDQLSLSLNDPLAAARTLTQFGLARSDDSLLRTAYARWITGLAQANAAERATLAEDAIQLLQHKANDQASCFAFQISLLTLPANQVQPVAKSALALVSQHRGLIWLAKSRGLSFPSSDLDLQSASTPEALTVDERLLAMDRLIEDAKSSPVTQSRIGNALRELDRVQALAVSSQIQAYDWLGDYAKSRSLVPSNLQASDRLAEEIAAVLASSADAESRHVALDLWNQIAARLPLGSPQWHQAKLAVLRLLVATKQQDEAGRLAEYVLLTHKPSDPGLLVRYQSYLKQP